MEKREIKQKIEEAISKGKMALQNEVVPEDGEILFLAGQPIIGVNTNVFNSILKDIVEDLIKYYNFNPTIKVEKCWIDYCNNPTDITINTLIEELCKINLDTYWEK